MQALRRARHAFTRLVFAAALLSTWIAAADAHGAARRDRSAAQARTRVRELIVAAERAYALGHYDFAIQAFDQAHALSRRHELVVNAARAYRQRYALHGRDSDLAQAVLGYERYLALAPRGALAGRARRELEALAPALERAGLDGDRLASAANREPRRTRLAVTSNVIAAKVRVDRGRWHAPPYFVLVAPGKHRVVVRAPGHLDVARTVFVPRHSVYVAAMRSRPKPALLAVEAPEGAIIHIDDKRVGPAPLPKPMVLSPGRHRLAVTENGSNPFVKDVTLARGTTTTIEAELDMTTQRQASWAMVGVGTASVAASIALGVLSVVELRRARDILDNADGVPLTPEKQREYDDSIDARDAYRLGSGITGGAGLAIFLVGGALFVLDDPGWRARPAERPEERVESGDVSARPLVSPSLVGGSAEIVF
jgi:hypothetical protein